MNRLQELAGLNEAENSAAVALNKAQQSSATLQAKSQAIKNIQAFEDAFRGWVKTLGIESGKVSKSSIVRTVGEVLTELGYK